MHDKPSILELVEAVRDFLEDKAMPQLKGQAAFHARVSANALGIVHRELSQGPRQDAAELEGLRGLLDMDGTLEELNRELCFRIRKGKMELHKGGLMDHLWQTTLDKVSIDQPKYSAYKKALEERA